MPSSSSTRCPTSGRRRPRVTVGPLSGATPGVKQLLPPRARCRAACPMRGACACVPHQEQQAQPQVQQ
eukprot:13979717-Alexandrium_andersonii.AAC.1